MKLEYYILMYLLLHNIIMHYINYNKKSSNINQEEYNYFIIKKISIFVDILSFFKNCLACLKFKNLIDTKK